MSYDENELTVWGTGWIRSPLRKVSASYILSRATLPAHGEPQVPDSADDDHGDGHDDDDDNEEDAVDHNIRDLLQPLHCCGS